MNKTNNSKLADFDFEHWTNIAQQNPAQFEEMRQQLLSEAMEQVPDYLKQRMQSLQWQIDQINNRSEDPMDACFNISKQMWDKAYGKRGLLDTLKHPEKILQRLKNYDGENVIPINKYQTVK